jgi:hypothetical protein
MTRDTVLHGLTLVTGLAPLTVPLVVMTTIVIEVFVGLLVLKKPRVSTTGASPLGSSSLAMMQDGLPARLLPGPVLLMAGPEAVKMVVTRRSG